jgi:hypothetical protein
VSRLAEAGKLGATMGAAGSFKEFVDMIGPILIGVLSQALGLTWGFCRTPLYSRRDPGNEKHFRQKLFYRTKLNKPTIQGCFVIHRQANRCMLIMICL